jgi:predicted lipoprotein with Yx(FWY)xxD motif
MALGDFTVAAREDGVSQWAFRGQPLYLFAHDVKSGDMRGEGAGWRAVVLHPAPPRPAWVRVVGTDAGALLADPRGMTIYAYDEDRNKLVYPRGEDCFGPCIAESWTPVAAERLESPIGNWSVIAAADGGLQWAYKGQPLYTSKLETRPGDLTGISPRRARAWRPIMHATQSIQGASPNG